MRSCKQQQECPNDIVHTRIEYTYKPHHTLVDMHACAHARLESSVRAHCVHALVATIALHQLALRRLRISPLSAVLYSLFCCCCFISSALRLPLSFVYFFTKAAMKRNAAYHRLHSVK